MKPLVLLVEDDRVLGESLLERLLIEGFDARWVVSAEDALVWFDRRMPAAVVCDIRLPGMDGLTFFRRLTEKAGVVPPVILMTGYGTIEEAISAIRLGVCDYLLKPFDGDELVAKLRTFVVPMENAPLGPSVAMQQVADWITRSAQAGLDLLITGPTGAGKEYCARFYHAQRGGDRPFVAVNCAAIPENLLEAELFGVCKGAYTGADRDRPGLFVQAGDGVILLDEIGDAPLSVQTKLLRVLQERCVRPLGGKQDIAFRAAVVCCTHEDLRAKVQAGAFREDLYYRIAAATVQVPALAERKEDIPWLAERILAHYAQRLARPLQMVTPEAIDVLLAYHWPGNVRELAHVLERCRLFAPEGPITAVAVRRALAMGNVGGEPAVTGTVRNEAWGGWSEAPETPETFNLDLQLRQRERELIEHALQLTQGRVTDAAQKLGISRKTLWEKMKKLGLSREVG